MLTSKLEVSNQTHGQSKFLREKLTLKAKDRQQSTSLQKKMNLANPITKSEREDLICQVYVFLEVSLMYNLCLDIIIVLLFSLYPRKFVLLIVFRKERTNAEVIKPISERGPIATLELTLKNYRP